MPSFLRSRTRCRHLIKYDGTILDLSEMNISALPLRFDLRQLKVKSELIQTAVEIAQLLDAAQFANCTKINMVPKGSPERIKLINRAMENESHLLKFTFVMNLVTANPTRK